ncbi:hypothetical protein, partial [Snodgrassella communis]|uniref:hypothetical protein n=1 Tax=Snodgrassella communis TaxID=2946699 RepID=UPI001EF466EC
MTDFSELLPVYFQANVAMETLAFAAAKVMLVAYITIDITLFVHRYLYPNTNFSSSIIALLANAITANIYSAWVDEVMPDTSNSVDSSANHRFQRLSGLIRTIFLPEAEQTTKQNHHHNNTDS